MKMMRQNYIKIIVIIGYAALVGLAIFGIVFIYKELVKYSEASKPFEHRKELVIITNTLAVLYQAEGTVGLLTIESDPVLKQGYDSLMNTVFKQIDVLKSISIDENLTIQVDSLNSLLFLKKKNTERLVALMNDFETQTSKEITRTTVLSKKNIDELDNILQKNQTNSFIDTTTVIGEKKGFFKRIRDAIKSDRPDTLIQVSNRLQTQTEDIVIPSIRDTIVDFIKEINRVSQRKNTAIMRQVLQRQNELYKMNEMTIAQINKIVDEIELHEYKTHLQLMEEKEATLKRSSDAVSLIAFAALVIAVIFMSWIIYSLSASQRLQREIEKAKKVVENLLISREQLLLTITHDIKAPIASIIGYLELMNEDKLPDKDMYYIENMQQSSSHILNLIKDLLDFHSIDHDKQKIKALPFSPNELITNIFKSFIPEADKKELRFELKMNINSEQNYISDPYRIRQVLNNLLSNAIKYTPGYGSVFLSSSVETIKDQIYLIILVQDTGPGIKEKDKIKIFDEFSRLEYTGVGIEGLGLGLNISNKLSKMLGGAIEIESTFGKGSIFTVKIPLNPCNQKETSNTHFSEDIQNTNDTPAINKNIKILFIDDDVVQLNLLSELMKRAGLVSYVCPNPLEALQLIKKERFDIIFSDIQMNDMNGFKLVEQIRSTIPETALHLPIIALSAKSMIQESKLKEAGFSGFLPKPFTSEQLFDVIKTQTSLNQEIKSVHSLETGGFAAITQFAGNDTEAAKNIIDSFITENKKHLKILETAFDEEDWKTIAGICHKMIALMKMIAAQELVSLLQEYEKGSQSKENRVSLLALIEEKIKEAEEFLSDFANEP
jgi:signal transduction histidine kinase/CheY-like chemotaxis protein/HPt (histidine-containing phosphotransfer) domain-containing protein